MMISARNFFEQYSEIRNSLRRIANTQTPDTAYNLGLAQKYSWANFKAQRYLDALKSIRQNASFCRSLDLLRIGNYKMKNPYFLDSFWDKRFGAIGFREIRRFALDKLPNLMKDVEGLDR